MQQTVRQGRKTASFYQKKASALHQKEINYLLLQNNMKYKPTLL